MAHLIDKAAVMAEIENYKNSVGEDGENCSYIVGQHQGQKMASEHFLSFLDTLEGKEVDLEKEYKDFVEEDPVYNKLVNGIVGKGIAEHFFELGLKAQKEE